MTTGTIAAPVSLTPTTETFHLWQLIKENIDIARVLKYFKALRTDIRITVVIRSAPTMYGAYMVSYQYGIPDNGITALVTSNAIIGDIATSEAIDIVIPFRNTHNFLATYPLTGEGSDEFYCTLFLSSLYTEAVSGGTNSLDYDIFFSLENVDGAFPTADSEVFPQSRRGTSIYMDQMSQGTEQRRLQQLSLYEQGVNHARTPLTNVATAATVGAALFGTSMKAIYDRHFGRSTETENIAHETIEQDAPSNEHAGKAKNVRQSFYGDLATLHGQDMPTLSEEVVPSYMYKPTEMNMGSDMTLKEIGERPGLHAIYAFSSAVPNATINLNFIMGGNRDTAEGRQPYTYGSFVSRYARFYRCDHKVALHFHTSPLVSARFRVDIQYKRTPSIVGVQVGDQSYEVPSEVFLVKGSQIKTFTIPFMSTTSVMPIGTTFAYMNITLMTPPTTVGTVASSVYMLATTSHPNLSIYSLQSARSTQATPVPIEVQPQSGIRQVHDAISESSFEGQSAMVPVGMPEIATLKAILCRFDTSKDPLISIDTLPVLNTREQYNDAPNLVSLTQLFAFISGSIENKVIYDLDATGRKFARLGSFIDTEAENGKVGDGESITLLPAWPILDFRTPYRASVPMVWRRESDTHQQPNMADVYLELSDIEVVYVRAGRDFAMHYLNYLPSIGWCKLFTTG